MAPVVIFQLVSGLCAVLLIGGFVIYRCRYIIWRGYFRAEFVCEDGEVIARTFRLKSSDTEFTQRIKGKVDTYGIVADDSVPEISEIVDDDAPATRRKVAAKLSDPAKRDAPDRRVYRTGRFRIPKAYYIAHRYEPINMLELKMQSKVSATRYRELARNTVTSQLLTAFTENPMREAMAFMMGVIVILGGILVLGYFLNSRIETVLQRLAG